MKFVTVRDLRGRSAKVWKDLKTEKDLILTSNGKPMAIITGVGEDSLESTLAALRRDRAVRAVREIQQDSLRRGKKISLREINAIIADVRRKRRGT
jgi:antitoxin (DNA-binding transcriptional repressor) of toxin-antitoxin stability system